MKSKNGTVISRRGLVIDAFDYIGQALNITYGTERTTELYNCAQNVKIECFRYTYVEMKDEDVFKYGWFQACANALLEGVGYVSHTK